MPPQFLVEPGKKIGDFATLTPQESRHLIVILRKRVGEIISLTDGQGKRFQGVIQSLSKREATVLLKEEGPLPNLRGRITLAPGVLKSEKMEFVLQKSVELGAARLIPLLSSRTVVEWKSGSSKMARWRKIAEAASKQCGRASHMTVEDPETLENLPRKLSEEIKIVFWEGARESLRDFLARTGLRPSASTSAAVLIGPEGGFSEDEIARAVEEGFTPLSLGPLILRAETASVTAMSLIQYEFGNI